MARTKIDYGIDLGTTNSSISVIENGEPTIKKTDRLKDTMPSCVSINRKGTIRAGDSAYNTLKRDKVKAIESWDGENPNSFIEFKRTMGTDKIYTGSNMEKGLNSEELSAEVLKTLKSFIQQEDLKSAVITVPSAFKSNQIDATRRAGELAGLDYIETLQEPVAASMAYGMDSKNKNGFWLVFDFGGGTFDSALLKAEDGILKVIDTEGDNHLGGKDLDMAIVDKIIMSYLNENYVIDSILEDDSKKQILRDAMKFYAEEAKIQLSFNDTHNILSDLGAIPGEDDNGEELELDIMVSQDDMKRVLSPGFQKAIDLSQNLLDRNNLNGTSLDSLILVGGPTHSPVLRNMLEQQIKEPDTSVDPMTVISRGAALYASTVDISEEIKEQTRDRTKVQLNIGHESSTTEMEELVTIKTLPDKTDEEIPEKVFTEINRGDKAWSSGKIEINAIGEVIEAKLNEGKTNNFEVSLFGENGSILGCEPTEFSIIQGTVVGSVTLPYNFGIEIQDKKSDKPSFKTVGGLEKNKSLPAIGTENGLKTQKEIRPGVEDDVIKIPLYQGEHGANRTRAIYNEHVYDVIINGNDLPALLPEESDVDLTIKVNKSQKISVEAYFPYLDHTSEINVPTDTVQSVETRWLDSEIQKAKGSLQELKVDGMNSSKAQELDNKIRELEKKFSANKNDVDTKQEVLSNLRKKLKDIDALNKGAEWPNLEKKLKGEFYRLEDANDELGNEKTTQTVKQLKNQLEEVIKSQDIKSGKALLEEIQAFYVQLTMIYQLIAYIREYNENFEYYKWKDKQRARQLINNGLQHIGENPNKDRLHPIVVELFDLLPQPERPSGDNSILVG